MGAFMLIPALVGFGITMTAGLALTVSGFLLCSRKGCSRRGLKVWAIFSISACIILMPLLCAVADEPDGAARLTAGRFRQMTEALAVWSLLPGFSLMAGGTAQIVAGLRWKSVE